VLAQRGPVSFRELPSPCRVEAALNVKARHA
jgi:hypothetical protein